MKLEKQKKIMAFIESGRYFCSESGNVFSRRNGLVTKLKPVSACNGKYHHVTFWITSPFQVLVHQFVALYFYGLQDEALHIDHIDGNGLNNCVANLEFVTPSVNTQRAANRGKMSRKGMLNFNHKLSELDVLEIRQLTGKVFQKELAERYKVSQPVISSVQLNKTWKNV